MYLQEQTTQEQLFKDLRILIADSYLDDQDLLTFILETENTFVISATSVEQAIEALAFHPVDIVFAGVNLLRDSVLLTNIKTHALNTEQEITTIAILDTNRSTNPQKFLDMGCQSYISMPFDPSEIIGLLATLTQPNLDYQVTHLTTAA